MRGNPVPDFEVVPLGKVWKEYLTAAQKQFGAEPRIPSPDAGVGVEVRDRYFVCGVGLYLTPFRVAIAENLVTNPDIPMWERHQGMRVIGAAMKTWAKVAGVELWLPIRLAGIKSAARAAGFEGTGLEIFKVRP